MATKQLANVDKKPAEVNKEPRKNIRKIERNKF